MAMVLLGVVIGIALALTAERAMTEITKLLGKGKEKLKDLKDKIDE